MTVEIFQPQTYAHAVPYERFAELRRTEPVCWIEEPAVGAEVGRLIDRYRAAADRHVIAARVGPRSLPLKAALDRRIGDRIVGALGLVRAVREPGDGL